ncbi:SdpI/YhfL protein family protein [uncultured archaeon]|nr:SdpI/YhfL protein family protein [uncultured archaeon]
MRGFWIAAVLIVGACLFASWAMLAALPEQVAVHWNLAGTPDGWWDKLPAVLFLPALMLGLALLLDFLPRLDPRRANIMAFDPVYEQFILALLFLLALLHLGLLSWAVGIEVPPVILLSVGLALTFLALARLLGATKPNYFIGVRTPWALEDDENWYATNRLAGRLYVWSVPISLLGLLVPQWAVLFILLAALGPALIACAYSYLSFAGGARAPKKLHKVRHKRQARRRKR